MLKETYGNFWIVWTPTNGANNPQVRHHTQVQAIKEAERLAAKHPGQQFCPCRVDLYIEAKVETVTHRLR